MKRQRGEASSGGIGIFGLLGVIFVTAKVLDVAPIASWSWWWVTAPFWGGLIFGLVVFAVVLVIAAWAENRNAR